MWTPVYLPNQLSSPTIVDLIMHKMHAALQFQGEVTSNLVSNINQSVFIDTSSSPSVDDLPDLSHIINSIEFTKMEVCIALSSGDPNKASDIDDILPRILQLCDDALYKPLYNLLTISLRYMVLFTPN